MLVLAPAQYKKKLCSFEQLPSLYSICVAGIVFLKTSMSLSRALRAFPRQTAPRCRFYITATTLVFLLYAVINKSMIGGYRTLLVMNSVNPLLIPLRYLNHV